MGNQKGFISFAAASAALLIGIAALGAIGFFAVNYIFEKAAPLPPAGPPLSSEERIQKYCSEAKSNSDGLLGAQFVCADLCKKDENFRASRPDICVSAESKSAIIE